MIAGAELMVCDHNGNVIAKWTSEKGQPYNLTGKLVVGGTYVLIETKAPEGYDLAEAIIFTVNENGKPVINGTEVDKIEMVDVEIKNDEEDVPPNYDHDKEKDTSGNSGVHTGDNSNIMLWITMFITSLMGVVYVLTHKKKEEVNG